MSSALPRYLIIPALAFALSTLGSCRHSDKASTLTEGRGSPTKMPLRHHGVVTFTTAGKTLRIKVEIVRSSADRARGLMYRKHLPELAGMLFIFPKQEILTFWMKNTYIPLDMIFIEEKTMKVVGVVENAEPMTEITRAVDEPSRYVVEVNAGFAKRHGIGPGTTMSFIEDPPTR